MTMEKLPPEPDPVTGLPRPPAVPLDHSWGHGHRELTDRASSPPEPPLGQGPTLEWTTRPWKGLPSRVAFALAILVGFLTLRDWGIGWMSEWKLWTTILVLSALAALFVVWAEGGLAAGADWVRYGKNWINIYELTTVKLGEPRARNRLILKDADGRDFSMGLSMLQTNPALWDLVYNGMLHSVHHGGATVNERARKELKLDPQLHFVNDDDL
jgi:hypothetical protein